MNRLFYNRVYLSGPIDNAKDFGVGWRKMIQKKLAELDLIFLDPCHKPMIEEIACEDLENHNRRLDLKRRGDFETLAREMRTIRCIDLRLADLCDFSIVHLDLNVYSTGTHEEITTLNRRKVPVLIHVEQGKDHLPDWYIGALPHTHIFSKWEDLIEYIFHVAYAPPPIDTYNRWRFLDYGKLYGMDHITLSKGQVASISPEDYKYLNKFEWRLSKHKHKFFAETLVQTSQGIQKVAMHNLILQHIKKLKNCESNHLDGNMLNNRRENLSVKV